MALAFDGSNDRVTYAVGTALNNLPAMTWAFWYQRTSGTAGANCGGRLVSASTFESLNAGSGTLSWGHRNSGVNDGRRATLSGFTLSEWHHFAVVFDGAQAGDARVRLFRDGTRMTAAYSGTGAFFAATVDCGSAVLQIGGLSGFSFTACRMAHHKMWAAALTDAEVAQEAWSALPQRTQDLRLWLPFDDAALAIDYGPNRYAPTVTQAVQSESPPVTYAGMR